jgi:hypothetical protein
LKLTAGGLCCLLEAQLFQLWRLDSGAVVGGDAVGDPAIQVDVGIAAGGRVRPIGKDDDGGDRGKRHHCDDGVGGE